MQEMHIISGIRYCRKLLGFLRHPGHAKGGLMHPRNMKWAGLPPARVCCVLVLLSSSWLFQKWQSAEFWGLLALVKSLLPLHAVFVLHLRELGV